MLEKRICEGRCCSGVNTHWLLANSFIVDGAGKVTTIVVDDSWTGKQVRTKQVTAPAGFPLSVFKVNGFQPVSFRAP